MTEKGDLFMKKRWLYSNKTLIFFEGV